MEPRLKSTSRIRGTTRPIERAVRAMRQDLTPAERVLWSALRNRKLAGLKFRRQHPVGSFILDFCCPERKLVVEVDGSVHNDQRDYDEARTEYLHQFGYQVVRFANEEVLSALDSVLSRILAVASTRESCQ